MTRIVFPRLRMRITKFIFSICAILLPALFINGAYYLRMQGNSRYTPAPVPFSQYSVQSDKTAQHMLPEYRSDVSMPVNLLVLGLDDDETRSDVLLLFHFRPDISKLDILSIARDTRVRSDGTYMKINALYGKGKEEKVAAKVSEITGLPIHYYFTVNLAGFRKIIDTLGGVRFYVPFPMSYDDPVQNLHIHLKKGMQLLDGKKAEQLVRYRKGNLKGQGYLEGDIGRIKVQQDFIKALIQQKVSIKYLSRADTIFEVLREYARTNITISDIVQYAVSAGRVENDATNAFTLPGESRIIGDVWYYIYDRKQTEALMNRYFFN